MERDERRPAKNAVAPLPQIGRDQASEASGESTPVQRVLIAIDDAVSAALEYEPGPRRDEAFELAALSLARGIAKYRHLLDEIGLVA